MLSDDERVSYYSKLSDEVKEEFISDVLQCLDYDNVIHYLNEYYEIRGNRFLEFEASDKRRWIIKTIKDRIAHKKISGHFWVSFKD